MFQLLRTIPNFGLHIHDKCDDRWVEMQKEIAGCPVCRESIHAKPLDGPDADTDADNNEGALGSGDERARTTRMIRRRWKKVALLSLTAKPAKAKAKEKPKAK